MSIRTCWRTISDLQIRDESQKVVRVFRASCGPRGQRRLLLELSNHLIQEADHWWLGLLKCKKKTWWKTPQNVFKLDQESINSYIIPVVQPRQVQPSLSVYMLALSDDHVGGRSQEAYGRSDGEWVHQPQQDGDVVGASFRQRHRHQFMITTSNMRTVSAGVKRSDLPPYLTGRLPTNFRRSFWVLSVKAELTQWCRQLLMDKQNQVWCMKSVFQERNSLYVPVDGVIPGKMRWIFCSSSMATSRNLY